MKNNPGFWTRLWAVIIKEFIQMKRDRATLSMIIGIPLIQVILFGFAINNNPKHLATAIVDNDHSAFTRAFIQGMENTGYFRITKITKDETEANNLLRTGKTLFILNIPANFTHDLIKHTYPTLLLEADATDSVSTVNAANAITILSSTIFHDLFQGTLNYLEPAKQPFELRIHPKYNPAAITQYNIVPGLLGVVLTMTMVMITAIAITRERERGTMEHLLSTPLQPLEVMLGKVTPYIMVGYLQIILILVATKLIFNVPIYGSILLLLIASLPFIAANLVVGLMLSTVAQNQLQSIQMTTFFFLPSILLSGFMFPFYGMPSWAQFLGNVLPLTHYLRITRGILLKGNGIALVFPELMSIFIFLIVIVLLGIKRYKKTLD